MPWTLTKLNGLNGLNSLVIVLHKKHANRAKFGVDSYTL